MLVSLSNLSTGLMAASMGGDLAPVLGSGNAYSVAYETVLPEGSYPGTRRGYHNRLANQALLDDMQSDLEFAQGMNKLIPNLTEQITSQSSQSPTNYTWHHNPYEPGLMQLVPRIQHESPLLRFLFLDPNGNGGYSNWGK